MNDLTDNNDFKDGFDSKLFETLSKCNNRVFFYYSNVKTNVSCWSKNAAEYFGLPSERLEPMTYWAEKIHPEDRSIYDEDMNSLLKGEKPLHNCEYRIKNAAGEYVWVNCRGYMTYDKDGNPDFFAGYVQPMGQARKIDELTGIQTYYVFRLYLDSLLNKNDEAAAMIIDIDNFKSINLRYGHSFGDDTLYTFAQTLIPICRKHSAYLYRYNGAKFVVLIKGGKDKLLKLYDEIDDAIENLSVNGTNLKINLNCGATLIPQDGRFFNDIDNNLVIALSTSKFPGVTKKIVFYSGELVKKQGRLLSISDELQECINDNFRNFSVVFQPVFDSKTGELHSAEALLRWNSEQFSDVNASEFIPILERNKNIIPVGKWVVDKTFKYVAEWRKHNPSHLPHVNINFSYIQFSDPTLNDYIIKKLDEYNLPHSILVAELTESCRLEYSPNLAAILQELKNEGISVALDDFGTGYASLMLLKEMPADVVKLDHTMMATIHNRPKDRGLVEFIIKYCNEIGIDVCTEGVETKEIQDIVTAAGTAYLQGYYYDKPLKTDDFYEKYIK